MSYNTRVWERPDLPMSARHFAGYAADNDRLG
jgi:hypothetical protein